MTSIEKESNGELVLVTGASGFIAGHIIKQLLERGYKVRGTVRQYKGKESTYEYLTDMTEKPDQIEFIECDLMKDDNWPAAVKGVKYVIHTANPMPDTDMGESGFGSLASGGSKKKHTPLSDDDYIKPAVDGMQRILDAILRHGKSVKRMIYTSSIGAINWENWDTIGNGKTVVYTHAKQWTPVGKCHVSSYAKSKTLAEQLGIEFVKKNNNPFELVTMHPGWVVGPLLNNRKPMSLTVLEVGFNGDFPIVPRIQWGAVDVRDVATAHVNAMKAPKAAGQRYLLVAECLWHKDIAELMLYKYGKLGYPISTREAPEFFIKILAMLDPEIGNFVLPLNGLKRFVDHRPSADELGLVYRPVQDSIIEACEDLISKELVKKPMSSGQRLLRKGALACVTLGLLAGSLYVFDKEKVTEIKKKVLG